MFILRARVHASIYIAEENIQRIYIYIYLIAHCLVATYTVHGTTNEVYGPINHQIMLTKPFEEQYLCFFFIRDI